MASQHSHKASKRRIAFGRNARACRHWPDSEHADIGPTASDLENTGKAPKCCILGPAMTGFATCKRGLWQHVSRHRAVIRLFSKGQKRAELSAVPTRNISVFFPHPARVPPSNQNRHASVQSSEPPTIPMCNNRSKACISMRLRSHGVVALGLSMAGQGPSASADLKTPAGRIAVRSKSKKHPVRRSSSRTLRRSRGARRPARRTGQA